MPERARVWVGAAIAVVVVGLYAVGLDRSPIYLSHDEVIYARNALSIARSGRDLSGQFLPISIPVTSTFFATPANIYFTAAFLSVLPMNEVTVRLPSVVVGLACVGLVFVIARRLFASDALASAAAGILLLTPAHFMHSRMGTDHLYLVVCVLAWLGLLLGRDALSARRACAAGACLGVSLYTYLGAAITAPVCLGIMLAWMVMTGRRDPRVLSAAVVGFMIPAVPFAAWHLTHPGQYAQQIRMYAIYDAQSLDAVAGARQLAAPASLAERASVYWDYFNPSFLFFAGDSSLINGTRYTGVFLLPMLVLLPAGLVLTLLRGGTPGLLLALVFAAGPVAATVVAERYRVNRALMLLPVAALLATAAVGAAWRSTSRVLRGAMVAMAVVMAVQFVGFYRDYFGDYRVRSAQWFEFNLRGAMQEIITRSTPANHVWISQALLWTDYYWPFYLERFQRPELLSQTNYFDPVAADLASIPAGTYVLCPVAQEPRLLSAGFTRIRDIREPDGTHSLSVLYR